MKARCSRAASLLVWCFLLAAVTHEQVAFTGVGSLPAGRLPALAASKGQSAAWAREERRVMTKLLESSSAKAVLETVERELSIESLQPRHFKTIFLKLVEYKASFSMDMQDSDVVRGLVATVLQAMHLDHLSAKLCANILWAVAMLEGRGACMQELVSPALYQVRAQVVHLKARHLAKALRAAATLQLEEKELRVLLPALCAQIVELQADFSAAEIANMIMSMAKLRGRSQVILEMDEFLAELAVTHARELAPVGLGAITSAVKLLKEDAPCLREAVPRLLKGREDRQQAEAALLEKIKNYLSEQNGEAEVNALWSFLEWPSLYRAQFGPIATFLRGKPGLRLKGSRVSLDTRL